MALWFIYLHVCIKGLKPKYIFKLDIEQVYGEKIDWVHDNGSSLHIDMIDRGMDMDYSTVGLYSRSKKDSLFGPANNGKYKGYKSYKDLPIELQPIMDWRRAKG